MNMVGGIYESTQKSHHGWRIRVTKQTPRHVEVEKLSSPHKGKREYFLNETFERDFELVQAPSILEEHINQTTIHSTFDGPEGIQCKQCHLYKPTDEFQRIRGGIRVGYCKECMHHRRTASRLLRAESIPVPQPPTVPTHSSITEELIAIATRVEQLGTPPELVQLATVVRDILLDASPPYNGTVMIAVEQYNALQDTFQEVKDKITWER